MWQPDPLTGALEAVLDDTLEADQPENEVYFKSFRLPKLVF